ncbi:helix-turn-helix domain-containing protein [Maribacter sp. HS]|uniref:helix-turn-helix domain-containing protein n=1 Tax=Maribacter sp. HS TaxID=3110480 RepID=UPI003A8C3CB5
MKGFIKLPREIAEWEWYQDSNTFRLYIHLILHANYTDKKFRGTLVRRGEFITSQKGLADKLNLSIQNIRTALKKLKTSGYITVKPTGKYTHITLVEYDIMQDKYTPTNTPTNIKVTDNQHKSNKLLTTTKEGKNSNEKNKETIKRRKEDFKNEVFKRSQYSNKILNDFFNYWSETSQKTFKMKWEDSKYFEIENRLKSWKNKEENWDTKKSKSDFVPSHNR